MGTGVITFIEFFFRTVVNGIRRIGSNNWPVVTAIVSNSERRGSGGYTVIVIQYKYRNAEMRYEGSHKEPFFLVIMLRRIWAAFPAVPSSACGAIPKIHRAPFPQIEKSITFG
jgi:hypothetical protein